MYYNRYKDYIIISFKMNKEEIYKCSFCKYTSYKKYNVDRHEVNKHSKEILNNENNLNEEKNTILNDKNTILNVKNTILNEKNTILNEKNTCCSKCNKKYKTIKSLLNHEKNCKGIDILTCPRCMTSFSNSANKSRHIKRNNCEPRSIIHAKTPNVQNINTTNNINNTTNNIDNSITNNNNNIQNTININNFGSERLDYLNYDKYLSIFKKNYDIPSALTKEIHFNLEFPENNNIFYNDKTSVLVKVDNNYLEKDTKLFVEELINNKSKIIQSFAHKNKTNICENMSCALYDEIIELLVKLIVKEPTSQYNKQTKKIMDLIRNNKVS